MQVAQELLSKLIKRTIEYISQDLAMDAIDDTFKIVDTEKLNLLECSVKIILSGYLKGSIILSVSNKLAVELTKNSIFGELEDSLLQELASENTAEFLNIVLGNVLEQLDGVKSGESLDISTPQIIEENFSIIKDKELFFCELNYKNEKLLIGYSR